MNDTDKRWFSKYIHLLNSSAIMISVTDDRFVDIDDRGNVFAAWDLETGQMSDF